MSDVPDASVPNPPAPTPTPTPREQAGNQVKLDRAAEICRHISALGYATRSLAREKGSYSEIGECAKEVTKSGRAAIVLLVALGAASPYAQEEGLASDAHDPFAADPFDLGNLAKLSDPETMADNAELLTLLEKAQAVAERLDLRRGHVVGAHIPLQPGESRGTDLAETISEIAFRLRYEMHGPVGKD